MPSQLPLWVPISSIFEGTSPPTHPTWTPREPTKHSSAVSLVVPVTIRVLWIFFS